MSEQIVREASAWQGTIEGDYRESAQKFAFVKLLARLPKTDQYLTKNLPNHLTRDAVKITPRLLERFFEQYFQLQMKAADYFKQLDSLISNKED